jgi:hypothetical protein
VAYGPPRRIFPIAPQIRRYGGADVSTAPSRGFPHTSLSLSLFIHTRSAKLVLRNIFSIIFLYLLARLASMVTSAQI